MKKLLLFSALLLTTKTSLYPDNSDKINEATEIINSLTLEEAQAFLSSGKICQLMNTKLHPYTLINPTLVPEELSEEFTEQLNLFFADFPNQGLLLYSFIYSYAKKLISIENNPSHIAVLNFQLTPEEFYNYVSFGLGATFPHLEPLDKIKTTSIPTVTLKIIELLSLEEILTILSMAKGKKIMSNPQMCLKMQKLEALQIQDTTSLYTRVYNHAKKMISVENKPEDTAVFKFHLTPEEYNNCFADPFA